MFVIFLFGVLLVRGECSDFLNGPSPASWNHLVQYEFATIVDSYNFVVSDANVLMTQENAELNLSDLFHTKILAEALSEDILSMVARESTFLFSWASDQLIQFQRVLKEISDDIEERMLFALAQEEGDSESGNLLEIPTLESLDSRERSQSWHPLDQDFDGFLFQSPTQGGFSGPLEIESLKLTSETFIEEEIKECIGKGLDSAVHVASEILEAVQKGEVEGTHVIDLIDEKKQTEEVVYKADASETALTVIIPPLVEEKAFSLAQSRKFRKSQVRCDWLKKFHDFSDDIGKYIKEEKIEENSDIETLQKKLNDFLIKRKMVRKFQRENQASPKWAKNRLIIFERDINIIIDTIQNTINKLKSGAGETDSQEIHSAAVEEEKPLINSQRRKRNKKPKQSPVSKSENLKNREREEEDILSILTDVATLPPPSPLHASAGALVIENQVNRRALRKKIEYLKANRSKDRSSFLNKVPEDLGGLECCGNVTRPEVSQMAINFYDACVHATESLGSQEVRELYPRITEESKELLEEITTASNCTDCCMVLSNIVRNGLKLVQEVIDSPQIV